VGTILDLLQKVQLIDDRAHDAVMSRTRSRSGGHIVQQVAELGLATESSIARAISVELGLPRIDLQMTPPEAAALNLLDARTSADRFVLPVALRENGELLWLAMADPTDEDAIGLVRRRAQKRVRPAVAGPTEILRAVRALYAAPGAGSTQPEPVQNDKLAAIEIEGNGDEAFEVLNVADDIGERESPLSRIAKELGVEVPANVPSQVRKSSPTTGPLRFEQLFTTATQPGPIETDDLAEGDISTLEALRSALEKGALVLRTLAELCVDKGVFTREEMKKRKPPTGPVKPL